MMSSASPTQQKPSVVFVLGGPGAGKGTQCSNIVRDFDFVHLSAGDLLRAEQATPGSEYGDMIKHMIQTGAIVPAKVLGFARKVEIGDESHLHLKVTIMLLKRAMETSGCTRFLIDGFPRNQDNNDEWYNLMKDHADVKFLLFMDCPEEEMEKRIMRRSEGSGRIDDNITSLRKRFVTYREQTMPIIQGYEAKQMCRKISAVRPVDDVYADVRALFISEFGESALRSVA